MIAGVGYPNIKISINFFDSVVSSIYRYSLGSWGVHCTEIGKFNSIYVSYILRALRLPRNTSRKGILIQTGRRCAHCDALYLGALQMAKGLANKISIWGYAVRSALDDDRANDWVRTVHQGLIDRVLDEWMLVRTEEFIAQTRTIGVYFDQYCFHNHLNLLTYNSADSFRINRQPGVYPLTLFLKSFQVRICDQIGRLCFKRCCLLTSIQCWYHSW